MAKPCSCSSWRWRQPKWRSVWRCCSSSRDAGAPSTRTRFGEAELGLLVPAIIALPLLGSAVLSLFGARLSKRIAGAVGASTVSASALLAFLAHLMIAAPDGYAGSIVSLGRWFELGTLRVSFALHLDPLSSV